MAVKKIIRERTATDCDEQLSEHPLLNRIYRNRGVRSRSELNRQLAGLYKPEQLKGLREALELLVAAITANQSILVVGDFDADGATSSAVAISALRALGHRRVDFLVPNRFEYGYGLTPEIVDVARQQSPDLIVTVDNGISSIEGVRAAKAAGIKVLVTDHHLPGAELPDADAIVNPNQPGCPFPSKNLAGVGVIFYVMSALRSALRERQWFQKQGIAEPNMAELLDLVALGTVADVVPLDSNNRLLVHQGLARIRAGRVRPGIKALLTVAGRNPARVVASDMGFALGPRLNAAGRLDDMALGIQCLLSESDSLAMEIASQLDDLNRDRKLIETDMQREAMAALAHLSLQEDAVPAGICLFDEHWHQGVIGILASRIKDRFHRPVIAFADAGDGMIKGSARSIPGLHIRDALDAIASQHPDILSKFGGHAMAAGMSLRREDFQTFADLFAAEAARQLDQDALEAVLLSDGQLADEDIDMPVASLLRDAGPWGQAFPEPLFDGRFHIVNQRIVGQKHLKMVLSSGPGSQRCYDAIAFNVDTERWPDPSVESVELAYRLDVNEFRGRENVQLLVEYIDV